MGSWLLVLLAIAPPVFLLIFTYALDKKEKEPITLLVVLFAMGVVSIIPAVIAEEIGGAILGLLPVNEFVVAFLDAFLVVAIAEEGFKYLLMRAVSWKHSAFNYRFDGIVYAVYTSLGFATFENVLYVLENGVGNALLRAVTSIPLHASCGVIMGIYYGRARGSANAGNKSGVKNSIRLALLLPILIHGFYDFCLFTGNGWLILLWLVFTVITFIVVFMKLLKSSKMDHEIVVESNEASVFGQEGTWFPQQSSEGRFGKWVCTCGTENTSSFCPNCGKSKNTGTF